jgi:hypothetical protein
VFTEPLPSNGHMRHNIKMNLKNTGFESVNWIQLTRDWGQIRAVVNTKMNLLFHKTENFVHPLSDEQIHTAMDPLLGYTVRLCDNIMMKN